MPLPNLAGLSLPTGVDPPDASAAAPPPARNEFAALREESSVLFATLMRALLEEDGIGGLAFCGAVSRLKQALAEKKGGEPKGGPTPEAYAELYEQLRRDGLLPHPLFGEKGEGETALAFFERVCRRASLLREYDAYLKKHFYGPESIPRPPGLKDNLANLYLVQFNGYRAKRQVATSPPSTVFESRNKTEYAINNKPAGQKLREYIDDPDFVKRLLAPPYYKRVPTWLVIYIVGKYKESPFCTFFRESTIWNRVLMFTPPKEYNVAEETYNDTT